MDKALEKAEFLWPQLASKIGLAPRDWRAQVLNRQKNHRTETLLLRLDGPSGRRLVFKMVQRPRNPEWFSVNMRAQARAWRAFPNGVPQVLCVDRENQACLMAFAPGETLRTLLKDAAFSEQVALLRRAGAWLAEFHRRLPGEVCNFRPAATMRILEDKVEATRAGTHPVIDEDRFLHYASVFLGKRRRYRAKSVTARAHGDMHLSNLLIGKSVAGIDLMGCKVLPVGHDIARLLSFYAISHAPRDVLEPGEVLPGAALEGFFSGYDIVGPDDPCVQLVLRQRVLAEWWALPASAEGAQLSQYEQDVLSLARNVFEPVRGNLLKRFYPRSLRATW